MLAFASMALASDGLGPEVITPVYDNEALGEFFQSQGLMRRHIAAADNCQGSVSIPKERPVTEGTIVDASVYSNWGYPNVSAPPRRR